MPSHFREPEGRPLAGSFTAQPNSLSVTVSFEVACTGGSPPLLHHGPDVVQVPGTYALNRQQNVEAIEQRITVVQCLTSQSVGLGVALQPVRVKSRGDLSDPAVVRQHDRLPVG